MKVMKLYEIQLMWHHPLIYFAVVFFSLIRCLPTGTRDPGLDYSPRMLGPFRYSTLEDLHEQTLGPRIASEFTGDARGGGDRLEPPGAVAW